MLKDIVEATPLEGHPSPFARLSISLGYLVSCAINRPKPSKEMRIAFQVISRSS